MSVRPLLWIAFLVVLVGILLGGVAGIRSRVAHEGAAIAEVSHLGGHLQTTQGGPRWLRRLVGARLMSVFDRATVVNLGDTETTDADLRLLADLRGVERLNLARTKITDAGLESIGRLTGLKALDLGGTAISDDGLAHLAGLTNLEYLYLDNTGITDAGLSYLEDFEHLRSLDVGRTAVTERGREALRKTLPRVAVVAKSK